MATLDRTKSMDMLRDLGAKASDLEYVSTSLANGVRVYMDLLQAALVQIDVEDQAFEEALNAERGEGSTSGEETTET